VFSVRNVEQYAALIRAELTLWRTNEGIVAVLADPIDLRTKLAAICPRLTPDSASALIAILRSAAEMGHINAASGARSVTNPLVSARCAAILDWLSLPRPDERGTTGAANSVTVRYSHDLPH
jgi:hypothetical protein